MAGMLRRGKSGVWITPGSSIVCPDFRHEMRTKAIILGRTASRLSGAFRQSAALARLSPCNRDGSTDALCNSQTRGGGAAEPAAGMTATHER